MMRRYYISLVVLTLFMALAAFCLMWFKQEWFLPVLPWLALYFGVTTGLLHYIVIGSIRKSPRAFVQMFLGSTVAMLIVHLAFIVVYVFTHLATGRLFLLAFLVGFLLTLVFETVSLVRFVNALRKEREPDGK